MRAGCEKGPRGVDGQDSQENDTLRSVALDATVKHVTTDGMTVGSRPVADRRRSDHSRTVILQAAWDLFLERGLREMSIEAIARRAGVGKTTIYRWWPSKAAVVFDALHEHLDTNIGFPDTGSVHGDLIQQVQSVIELLGSPPGKAFLALVGESQHDAALAEALRDRYIVHRRAAATEAVTRGIARGEIPADLDPALLIDIIYGAVYYRFLVSHASIPPRYTEHLVRAALGAAPGPVDQ